MLFIFTLFLKAQGYISPAIVLFPLKVYLEQGSKHSIQCEVFIARYPNLK